MLEIHLRDKNNVINMTIPNKEPLRGRKGHSPFYHNANDYLCAALGLCCGGVIVDYCRFNNINVRVFESILVYLTKDKFIITISIPKDFGETNMMRLRDKIEKCPVAKTLTKEVEVEWVYNITNTKELLKEPKGCCG